MTLFTLLLVLIAIWVILALIKFGIRCLFAPFAFIRHIYKK